MLKYILRRIFQGIFVLIGISILIFVISRVVPGDAARMALGPKASEIVVEKLKKEMYLDRPIPVQYFHWFKNVLKGDFGKSLYTKRPVSQDIKEFFPATIELVLYSSLFYILFAMIFGILSMKYRDTWIDNIIRSFSYIGIAVPSFVIAVLLMLVFGHMWHILPTVDRLGYGIIQPPRITGMITIDSLITGNLVTFFDALKHLILPSIALSFGVMFQEARILRSSLIDNMNKEYISVVTGYGMPKDIVIRKYLLKPSFIPVVSVMGLDIASLVSGAFLIETIFNWPGFSRYGLNAMLNKDLNAISAVVVVVGLVFLIVNIVVDMIIAALDPRVRLGGGQ